jgi:antitoxin HicB
VPPREMRPERFDTSVRSYTILLDPDPEEGGFTVTVPALPGVITQGETVDACIERAREAISLHIEGLVRDGDPVPEEVLPPQLVTIAIPD